MTLRITDGYQGQAEAPVARSRAFQLTTKEARAASDVAGAYLLLSYQFLFMILLILSCIGTSKCILELYFLLMFGLYAICIP